jgi:hypothetical protein
MNSPNILVISDSDDEQARLIYEAIALKNESTVTILINELSNVSVEFGVTGSIDIYIDGAPSGPFDALYFRLKHANASMDVGTDHGVDFVRQLEWNGLARGLQAVWKDVDILPHAGADSTYKVFQLATAQKVGFKIPRSRIVMGKDAALSFVEKNPDVVVKNLNTPRYPRQGKDLGALITKRVSEREIQEASPEEFQVCPTFLQEEVPSTREIRTISFRDKSYTYEQSIDVAHANVVDKRVLRPNYRLIDTPPEVEFLCSRYLEHTGLFTGSFDIIQNGDDYIFLECNVDGQWHAANGNNIEEVVNHFAEKIVAFAEYNLARRCDSGPAD